MLFGYFTQLVDAYAKVLQPSNKLRNLAKEKMDRFACLEKAVQRWEYTSFEEERKKREKSAEDEDRVAYLNIDWYDFTVVETIAFPADEFFPHEALKDEQNGAGTENGGCSLSADLCVPRFFFFQKHPFIFPHVLASVLQDM